MIIVSGVNVFPSQIESLLLDIPEIEPQYCLVLRKKGYLDRLTVRVECRPEAYAAGPEARAQIAGRVAGHIKSMVGLGVTVDLVEPKLITRSEGKAKRVFDERPKDRL
jgi:phenylacetate-CoA ligase